MKRSILSIFAVLFFVCAHAQVDTEFWFACPDLSASHFQSSIRLCITTFDQPATVTISQPANPSFTPIVNNISANSYVNVPLGSLVSQVETVYGAVRKTGLLIQSTSKITAYYANYADNSEIYAMKGKNALGNDFIVPSQYSYDNDNGTYGGGAAIEVLATENNTNVVITPSHACVGHPANQDISITLNKGETYAVKAQGVTALSHLFNSRVKSDKPIAVNYTDDGVAGPGVDLVGDQLVPLRLAGTQYIAIRYGGNVEELYFFPATEDSTTVYANGVQVAQMKGCGSVTTAGKAKLVLPVGATYINSDHPIIVLQITSNGTELGGAILPSLTCTGSEEIAYKYTQSSGATISIVTKTEFVDGFAVNGDPSKMPSTFFLPVPGAPEWSYTYKPATETNQIRITNSKGVFHMGVIDNPGSTCSFGYFSNFNSIPLGIGSDKSYYIEGGDLHLSIANEALFTNIHWTGPNGFVSDEASPIIHNVTAVNAGAYVVTGSHIEGCDSWPDTLRVSVFKPHTYNVSVCYDSDAKLTANGFEPFSWIPGTLPAQKTVSIPSTTDGTYTVESHQQGFNRVSVTSVQEDNTMASEVLWEESYVNLNTSDRHGFSARFFTEQGQPVPTIQLLVNGQPVGNTIVPSSKNSLVEIEWPNVTANATFTLQTTANSVVGGSVSISDICVAPIYAIRDTFVVSIRDSLSPIVSGDEYVCHGKAVVTVEGDYDSYLWSTGETTQSIIVSQPGKYSVLVKQDDCHGTGYYEVKNPAEMSVSINPIPQICQGDTIVTIDYTLLSGTLDKFDVLFDDQAHQAGFHDMIDQLSAGNSLDISIPTTATPNVYHADLSFWEPICNEKVALSLDLPLRYGAEDVITQRWDDVLGVKNAGSNGGYNFVAFQWYKNDQILEGENGAYLYIRDGQLDMNAYYSVELTRDDSVVLFSCDYYPEHDPRADQEITLQESIVNRNAEIVVQGVSESSVAKLWNIMGGEVLVYPLNKGINYLTAPAYAGWYVLEINDTTSYRFKIIVE